MNFQFNENNIFWKKNDEEISRIVLAIVKDLSPEEKNKFQINISANYLSVVEECIKKEQELFTGITIEAWNNILPSDDFGFIIVKENYRL